MSPISFYRVALILPIVIPILFLPLSLNFVSGLLLMSLVFGGIQYTVFALVMNYKIGRLGSLRKIRQLSYWSPLIYIPYLFVGWFAYSFVLQPDSSSFSGVFGIFLLLALYSLAIGYAYVFLIAGISWLIFRERSDV